MFAFELIAPTAPARPATMIQGSLLCAGEPVVPGRFEPDERFDLGKGAWIDWSPDWLPGSDAWFSLMRDTLPWVRASRPMYERIVEVPRLLCSFAAEGREGTSPAEAPPALGRLRRVFEEAYGRPLPRVGANWYRSGCDSVAPHADRVAFPGDSIVVIVAVGERRPFTLQPTGGGRVHRFDVGRGDVLVMGGTTQAFWQHGVPKIGVPKIGVPKIGGPKIASTATRISLMFRSG